MSGAAGGVVFCQRGDDWGVDLLRVGVVLSASFARITCQLKTESGVTKKPGRCYRSVWCLGIVSVIMGTGLCEISIMSYDKSTGTKPKEHTLFTRY